MQQVTLEELRQLAAAERNSGLIRIISHWSAGHHNQPFADYDINNLGDGTIVMPNLILSDVEAHCWRRNSDSIGAAICCCYQGNTQDLGPEAPTEIQIERQAQIIAAVCSGMGWPIDREHAPTHEEMATIDGYGPGSGDPETRWDLWFLRNGDVPGTGGDQLRAAAQAYANQMGWETC
jgi:hypothetical protein